MTRPKPEPCKPRRSPGYVLITVLVLLALVTTVLAGVQITTRRALNDLPVEAAMAERRFQLADFIALAPSLTDVSGPILIDENRPWIEIVSADGLVDLNQAAIPIVVAVLSKVGIDSQEATERLESARELGTQFASVKEGLSNLGLPASDQTRVSRYFTVDGSASVKPSLVPDAIRSAVTRALRETGTEPLIESASPIYLILSAPEKDAIFNPLLTLQRSSTIDAFYLLEIMQ